MPLKVRPSYVMSANVSVWAIPAAKSPFVEVTSTSNLCSAPSQTGVYAPKPDVLPWKTPIFDGTPVAPTGHAIVTPSRTALPPARAGPSRRARPDRRVDRKRGGVARPLGLPA